MELKILFSADFHLGMKFASLPEAQAELAEARFSCLKRLVDLANERSCDLFVVAGDLFHRTTMPKKDVQRAAGVLAGFHGALAAVLPGNHDYLSAADELWKRFCEAGGSSLLLLAEQKPYPLSAYGLDACLYPGPCASLHSKTNAVSWIKASGRDPSTRRHIGVAHGSLEGISPDFKGEYYPMKAAELASCGLDLWLLGHTHIRYPESPTPRDRVFIAGTPEPDGFDCPHAGSAWLIRLPEEGAASAEALVTGEYRFSHESAELRGAEDLAALEKRLQARDGGRELLKAVITGRLPPDSRGDLDDIRKRSTDRFFHLVWDADGVREEITQKTIEAEYSTGSFPHGLLQELARTGDAEALEIAYELLQGARR
jgi:DNA repair protein SbcD/Mre11